jgi:hypothetical protein
MTHRGAGQRGDWLRERLCHPLIIERMRPLFGLKGFRTRHCPIFGDRSALRSVPLFCGAAAISRLVIEGRLILRIALSNGHCL